MARNRYDVDEVLETPFDFAHLKRSFVYIKKYKGKMITALMLSVFAAISGLLGPLITQYALDNTIPQKNMGQLVLLTLAFIGTIAVSITFSTIRSRIMTVVGQDIIFDIRTDLFKHLQELPFEYYDNRPHGKILIRVVNYVNSVSDMLSNGIINVILECLNMLFIMIFMFFVNVKLSLVVLSGLPIFAVIMMMIKKRQRKAWQDVSNKSSNLNAYLQENITGARVTQIFTREEENAQIFDRLSEKYRKSWINAVKYSNLVWPATDNVSTLVRAAIFVVGLLVLTPAAVSLGTIVAMTSYASSFWQPIMNLSNIFNNFINNIAYLERIFETLDEPATIADKPNAQEIGDITGEVKFDDVTFSYEQGKTVLEHISFDVKPGESVALVGPTGAGKSTVVSLLSRFYDLDSGKITIDGKDISQATLHSLRSQMGIMLQDSFIFSGTIYDNIRYGRLDATEEEIREAAKIVCADEFISEMKDGYMTEVNERGSKLSGGQKQLISFARTLLSDPKILVLDEATSSIDARTEKLLQQGLQRLLVGRTSFIIAHRLSTIKNCDKIMYIDNKGIAECGTHDQLIAKKGEYYKLYTAQHMDE
ncbi:ABC transporter ATP-binding protein [Ruminococcus sp. AF17-6LB]|uniref:ABC transporter ATP-binding protein n=1 Tax=unclassified Ruminococcus TaxID=2608920 RepID=UPI000E5064AB|nr:MULTISPECIES: ABC transporter ATP-binding protein [unclassified Ruminococcus]RGG72038.1 ABC transporter ATP-binding protein [Ruminococcus sp. AF17-6LB]RGG73778.1 ABC transporter ATP-binding protein [Ruminococcus sp. AF17-6]RGG73957.1 ABC transporter ATP-binding protein [Ruminococcus sp. AF17-24]RGG80849.1 ABC transporter ATP-binding protein [Ruminococcus sp. AF17-1AC]